MIRVPSGKRRKGRPMTTAEIESKIRATIDQFYQMSSKAHLESCQVDFIGGVLQTALHLLPTDRYYSIKQYVYVAHGYDPGGVVDGQISMSDMVIVCKEVNT